MPVDPILVADTQGWLRNAARDLRAAKHDLAAIPPLLADAAFHCQQAVEKVFKAFLMWHSVPFRKTHSLEELGEQCLDVNSTLRALIDCAVPLTEYAWQFRYPGDPEEPSFDEVKEALQIARKVYDTVLGLLPENVRPS